MKKRVLIVGSGGREHALAWKVSHSPQVAKVYIAPGNGGTQSIGENVPIDVMDFKKLIEFARHEHIDLTIVGPDDPLASGIVDRFQADGLRVFGPTQAAAQIEASKAFSKNLMHGARILTATFATFTDYEKAQEYIKGQRLPIVVKASGLALGKGVIICHSRDEAKHALHEIMIKNQFGEAGSEVVIEEFLEGQEVSIHAISDGKNFAMFPSAQDHKPIFDEDKGPNTGGMGTYAPVPWVSGKLMSLAEQQVVRPTLDALAALGAPFAGCLYPGLKIVSSNPQVLEFNARFGDPETQSYMRLLKADLVEILEACVDGRLDAVELQWRPGFAVCIVLASGGYPGNYQKGLPISGVEQAQECEDVVIFHAGTKVENGQLVTNGGRVLNVTATGSTLSDALDKAYGAIKYIHFKGMQYRTDIGAKAL